MSEIPNVKQLARSKQRHSFNKDKQHSRRGRGRGDAGGRGGGDAGGMGGGDAGRGRGRGGGVPIVEEDSDEDSDEEEREDTSKFRRRPVIIQDRKFELNETVDDDEIPKLDIDYLLKQPIKEVADAHFKFADENEWEFTGAPNATIVIDCAKIAQKMKMLSMSQRLDLDLSPFGEPPLEEFDPLHVHTTLKFITLLPDTSPSSLPSSISSSFPSSQKHTAEDAFLDDLLNATPSTHTTSHPPHTSSHVSAHTTSHPPHTSHPSAHTHSHTPPHTSAHTSAPALHTPPPTFTHSSEVAPHASETTNLPASETKNPTVTKTAEKIGDATKASVEDLEDWLDSVI